MLADGSDSLFDIYETTVIWHGRPKRVPVDEVDCDPLIGMSLLGTPFAGQTPLVHTGRTDRSRGHDSGLITSPLRTSAVCGNRTSAVLRSGQNGITRSRPICSPAILAARLIILRLI